ncbi:uncharacterized protein LOC114724686 [Neltuma alba]|uniref:uncharacterized protein LOC114724686 n=1 Tax=Neltuma alba TaxID=207710 RepID=UPI0010A4D678|nr:uncharacterized protein LOC114724686 [Prosopis alba]
MGKYKHQIFNFSDREETVWKAPPQGYLRLDTDASVNHEQKATGGGIIRDSYGQWILGYQCKLGYAQSTTAELHTLRQGLQCCQQYGLKNVIAYTDSMEAYNLIMRDGGQNHPLREEINAARNMIFSEWVLQLKYAPRDTIRCADRLAKTAHDMAGNFTIWTTPTPNVWTSLRRRVL